MNELEQEYTAGWTTAVDTELLGKGLNEQTVRLISAKNNEPDWLLEWRLSALFQTKRNARTCMGRIRIH